MAACSPAACRVCSAGRPAPGVAGTGVKHRALSRESVEVARARRRAGTSLRDIAAELGTSHETIRKVLAAEPTAEGDTAAPTSEASRQGGLEGAEQDNAEPVDDELAFLKAMRARFLKRAEDAERKGNLSAAQRAGRDAAGLSPAISALTRERKRDRDTLHISRAEIAAAHDAVITKANAILQRPMLCQSCSRRLSATLAGRGEPDLST